MSDLGFCTNWYMLNPAPGLPNNVRPGDLFHTIWSLAGPTRLHPFLGRVWSRRDHLTEYTYQLTHYALELSNLHVIVWWFFSKTHLQIDVTFERFRVLPSDTEREQFYKFCWKTQNLKVVRVLANVQYSWLTKFKVCHLQEAPKNRVTHAYCHAQKSLKMLTCGIKFYWS